MTVNSIPQPSQAIAGNLPANTTWYRWLRDFAAEAQANGADVTAAIEAIARRLGSPDGSIDGIPEQVGVSVLSPITLTDSRISLSTVTASVVGSLFGITTDQWGRVTGLRPVVAGPGIVIDEATDPNEIAISSTSTAVSTRITTTGDFRRTTQNDLRAA